jgi:peptidyl-prolyl cis-trans isomerase C
MFQNTFTFQCIKTFVLATTLATAVQAFAQAPSKAPVPLATLNKLAIYPADIEADLNRLPPEARQKAATDPATMQQIVGNLLVRRALAERAEKEGLHKETAYKKQMQLVKERLLSDAWLAKIDAKNQLSQAELLKLAELKYKSEAASRFKKGEEIKISHILLQKDDEGKAKAAELLEQLQKGADFAELAKTHSKDPGSAGRGGDLGIVGKGRMVAPFEEAAFALKSAGELSGIVETGFGYHIIKLEERMPETAAAFEEVRDLLLQEVQTKARNDARNEAARELFSNVKLSEEEINKFVESNKKAPN